MAKKNRTDLKQQIKALKSKLEDKDAQIVELQQKNSILFTEMEGWRMKFIDAQNRVNRYQTEATANTRHSLDLQYMEVEGKSPILWINSPDPTVVNHGTFANIRDRLKRLAPKIEMIILTYGDVRLWELSDEDLNRAGLARIKNHTGGSVTAPLNKLEHKGTNGS